MLKFIGLNILVLVVILLRKIAGNRISGKLRYRTWLLVPLFMVLSLFVTFKSPVDMTPYVPEKVVSVAKGERPVRRELPVEFSKVSPYVGDIERPSEKTEFARFEGKSAIGAEPILESGKDPVVVGSDIVSKTEVISEEKAEVEASLPEIDAETALKAVWIAGAVITFAVFMVVNIAFALKIRKKRVFYKTMPETGAKVYFYTGMNSPFLFLNRIYIHPKIAADESLLRYSIIHENCHRKQGDSWWPLLKFIVLSLLWFDPLFWYAAKLVSEDCEMACDERVVEVVGDGKRKDYAKSLLTVFEMGNPTIRFTAAASLSANGKSTIKERIKALKISAKKSVAIALIVVTVLMGTVACNLTDPFSDKTDESKAGEEQTEEGSSATRSSEPIAKKLNGDVKRTGKAVGYRRIRMPHEEDGYNIFSFEDNGIVSLTFVNKEQPLYGRADPQSCILTRCDTDGNLITEKEIEVHDYDRLIYYHGVIALFYFQNFEDEFSTAVMVFDEDLNMIDDVYLGLGAVDYEVGSDGTIYAMDYQGLVYAYKDGNLAPVMDLEGDMSKNGEHKSVGGSLQDLWLIRIGEDVFATESECLRSLTDGNSYKLVNTSCDSWSQFISSPDGEILQMGSKLQGLKVEFSPRGVKFSEPSEILTDFPADPGIGDTIALWIHDVTKTDSGRIFFGERYAYEAVFDEADTDDSPYFKTDLPDGVYEGKFSSKNIDNDKIMFDIYDYVTLDDSYAKEDRAGTTLDLTSYGYGEYTYGGVHAAYDGPDHICGAATTGEYVEVDSNLALYKLEAGGWLPASKYTLDYAPDPYSVYRERVELPVADDVKIFDEFFESLFQSPTLITTEWESPEEMKKTYIARGHEMPMDMDCSEVQFRYCTITVENGEVTKLEIWFIN